MKQFKSLVALVLALALVLSVAGVALAQTEALDPADADGAKITVNNASKGETYSIVKLFDATVTGTTGGSIAYQGDIPQDLDSIFTKDDDTGAITYTGNGTELTTAEAEALKTWAENQQALLSVVSDGSALEFTGLPYGYYVVLTTQGAGAVTVTSTNPSASVNDKNTTTITGGKTVEKETYSIGDTINYTATFGTTNFNGTKIITKYEVQDTLPKFLTSVGIDSVKVYAKDADVATAEPIATLTGYTAFDANNKISIPWADKISDNPVEYQSKYPNGAKLVVKYHGTLTDITNYNADDTNTVTLIPYDWDGTDEKPWEDDWHWDAKIKTYGAAIHKVDENDNNLPGATFKIKGLTVKNGDAAGEYIVVSYNASSNDMSAELATNDNGYLYIVGLASDVTLSVTEFNAPDGYNKLGSPVDVTPQVLSEQLYHQDGWIKYDAKNNVVESYTSQVDQTIKVEKNLSKLEPDAIKIQNLKGAELPSTGGIGTTIIYVVGAVLVLGAAAVILARRKAEQQ